MSNRNAEFLSQQHAKHVSRSVREVEAVDFFNLLTAPELLEMTDSLLPEHRERLYPPTLALSMFADNDPPWIRSPWLDDISDPRTPWRAHAGCS